MYVQNAGTLLPAFVMSQRNVIIKCVAIVHRYFPTLLFLLQTDRESDH